MRKSARNLIFDQAAFEDLIWWVKFDHKKALRVMRLVDETMNDPFRGLGKPEPLKHELSGLWSRRIDDEHRLIYQVFDDSIRILTCRYHY